MIVFLKKERPGTDETTPVEAKVLREVPQSEKPCVQCGRTRDEHPGRHRFVEDDRELLDLELRFTENDPDDPKVNDDTHVRVNVPKGDTANCWTEA